MAVRALSPALSIASAGHERLKQALAAAVITFLLTSLIVGIETVSSTGELTFNTRYKEVVIAKGDGRLAVPAHSARHYMFMPDRTLLKRFASISYLSR